MATIDNKNTIKMVRGDTAIINLGLKANGENYVRKDGDRITFTVKEDYDDYPVIQKDITGTQIILSHEDTQNLEVGTYVYDIEVCNITQQVATIGPYKLVLTQDVTSNK